MWEIQAQAGPGEAVLSPSRNARSPLPRCTFGSSFARPAEHPGKSGDDGKNLSPSCSAGSLWAAVSGGSVPSLRKQGVG